MCRTQGFPGVVGGAMWDSLPRTPNPVRTQPGTAGVVAAVRRRDVAYCCRHCLLGRSSLLSPRARVGRQGRVTRCGRAVNPSRTGVADASRRASPSTCAHGCEVPGGSRGCAERDEGTTRRAHVWPVRTDRLYGGWIERAHPGWRVPGACPHRELSAHVTGVRVRTQASQFKPLISGRRDVGMRPLRTGTFSGWCVAHRARVGGVE